MSDEGTRWSIGSLWAIPLADKQRRRWRFYGLIIRTRRMHWSGKLFRIFPQLSIPTEDCSIYRSCLLPILRCGWYLYEIPYSKGLWWISGEMNELIHVALTVLLVLIPMRWLLLLPLQPHPPQSAFYPASTLQQLRAPPHGQVGSLKHGTKQLQNSNYLFQLCNRIEGGPGRGPRNPWSTL